MQNQCAILLQKTRFSQFSSLKDQEHFGLTKAQSAALRACLSEWVLVKVKTFILELFLEGISIFVFAILTDKT